MFIDIEFTDYKKLYTNYKEHIIQNNYIRYVKSRNYRKKDIRFGV